MTCSCQSYSHSSPNRQGLLRVANLSHIRLIEKQLARQRLQHGGVRHAWVDTLRSLSISPPIKHTITPSPLVKSYVDQVGDPTLLLGTAHRAAQIIEQHRTHQQVVDIRKQEKLEQLQLNRAAEARVEQCIRRTLSTTPHTLRVKQLHHARNIANHRSIHRARSKTKRLLDSTLPLSTNSCPRLSSTSNPVPLTNNTLNVPSQIPIVEYQSTRYHSTLLRDVIPYQVTKAHPIINSDDIHSSINLKSQTSAVTFALNEQQRQSAMASVQQHQLAHAQQRAQVRGAKALAKLRDQKVYDQVHSVLELARARDWDRRKHAFAQYQVHRQNIAMASVPDQNRLERGFINRFPDACRLMELIHQEERSTVLHALNRDHELFPNHSLEDTESSLNQFPITKPLTSISNNINKQCSIPTTNPRLDNECISSIPSSPVVNPDSSGYPPTLSSSFNYDLPQSRPTVHFPNTPSPSHSSLRQKVHKRNSSNQLNTLSPPKKSLYNSHLLEKPYTTTLLSTKKVTSPTSIPNSTEPIPSLSSELTKLPDSVLSNNVTLPKHHQINDIPLVSSQTQINIPECISTSSCKPSELSSTTSLPIQPHLTKKSSPSGIKLMINKSKKSPMVPSVPDLLHQKQSKSISDTSLSSLSSSHLLSDISTLTVSTWGTTTIDDMLAELESWLSDVTV